MDLDSEKDLGMKRLSIYGPNANPEPANGKRWWWETWGKALSTVIGALMLAALYYVGGKALILKAATIRVYETPARVDRLEDRLNAEAARPQMPPDLAVRLDAFLKAQETKGKR